MATRQSRVSSLVDYTFFFTFFLIKSIMNNQTNAPALTIVELEERFETTVAALDSARCNGNSAEVSAL
jgi:hypothetical protein